MKIQKTLAAISAILASAGVTYAQGLAPASLIGNTIFTGTLVSATGGANSDGTFSDLFSVNGMDSTLGANGAMSNPAAYTYANTGANTGTITESGVSAELTFTSTSGGTFVATYTNGSTQTGSFTLASLGVPTALNSLVGGSSLLNFSNMVSLAPGETSTAGFVIGGTQPVTVLIRAVGPGLSQFGIKGTLATPMLTIDGASGTAIGTDTGLNNSTSLQTAFSQAGAFSLPSNSADSAIVETLAPGSYTIQVASTSATDSGDVLVEVYVVN